MDPIISPSSIKPSHPETNKDKEGSPSSIPLKDSLQPEKVQTVITPTSEKPLHDPLTSRRIELKETQEVTPRLNAEKLKIDPASLEKIEKLEKYIDVQINKYEGWKKTAATTAIAALSAIVIGLIVTAAFYATPIIPFALVLLVPVLMLVVLFVSLLVIGTGGGGGMAQGASNIPLQLIIMAWGYTAKAGIKGGIAWSKMIYTVEVAKIVGFANAAVAAVSLPVAAGAGIAYAISKKKMEEFNGLKSLIEGIKKQPENYELLAKEQKEKLEQILAKINKKQEKEPVKLNPQALEA